MEGVKTIEKAIATVLTQYSCHKKIAGDLNHVGGNEDGDERLQYQDIQQVNADGSSDYFDVEVKEGMK